MECEAIVRYTFIYRFQIDHDNIRKGSAVFARIEPYLRTTNVGLPALVASSTSSNEDLEQLNTTSNQNILGGELPQNQWIEQTVTVDKKRKESFLY